MRKLFILLYPAAFLPKIIIFVSFYTGVQTLLLDGTRFLQTFISDFTDFYFSSPYNK